MEGNIDKYIQGCLANNAKSQEELYKYCFDNFMKVCYRYHSNSSDASASFNKAMHTVFDKLKMYKAEGAFLGWVKKIIINTCLNDLRGRFEYSQKDINEHELISFNAIPEAYSNISEKEILQLVQELPNITRVVFNLYIMEGFNHIQISDALKIPVGTSKWHLNKARTTLKERIVEITNYQTKSHAK